MHLLWRALHMREGLRTHFPTFIAVFKRCRSMLGALRRSVPPIPIGVRRRFARQFDLTRLVVAVVFLGAFVGLNFQKIGPVFLRVHPMHPPVCCWGWPFPFAQDYESSVLLRRHQECEIRELERRIAEVDSPRTDAEKAAVEAWDAACRAAASYRLPWAHQSYRLIPTHYGIGNSTLVLCGIIDALVALIPLALILFFHPRKPPDEAPA